MSLFSRVRPLRQALRSWRVTVIALVATVLLFTVASVVVVVSNDGAGRRAGQAEALAVAYGQLQVALLQVEVARQDLRQEGGSARGLRLRLPVVLTAYERVEELEHAGDDHAGADHEAGIHLLGPSLSDYLAGVSLLSDQQAVRPVDDVEQEIDAQVQSLVARMGANSAERQEEADLAFAQMRDHQRFGARVFPVLGGLSLLLVLACVRLLALQRRRLAGLRSEAQSRAVTDELTGLANRAGLQAALRARLPTAAPEQLLGLLLLDLDGFKAVNDTFGHGVGDEVLQVVADRLRDTAPDSALVARLGGDEFVVLMSASDEDEVERMAGSISTALSAPTVVQSVLTDIGASIGMSITDGSGEHDSTAASELLRRADIAMYAAKKAQHGPVLFSSVLSEQVSEGRLGLLSEVRRALQREELRLHYQAVVRVDTGEVLGVEALLRWTSPTRGEVQPDAFIPAVEDSPLIFELTSMVLSQALSDCARWRLEGFPWPVSVNVSAKNIEDPALPTLIQSLLKTHGLPGEALQVEVTEAARMQDRGTALSVLRQLRGLGVLVALDDFGTGYTALRDLAALPVDTIKIAGALVNSSDPDDMSVLEALVKLSHRQGRTVIAEGVEHADTAAMLAGHGCEQAQGWLWARAMPLEELMAREARALPVPAAPWLVQPADVESGSGRAPGLVPVPTPC